MACFAYGPARESVSNVSCKTESEIKLETRKYYHIVLRVKVFRDEKLNANTARLSTGVRIVLERNFMMTSGTNGDFKNRHLES